MKKLALALFAAGAITVPATAQMMSPGVYVAEAGAGDMYERQSSQLVLQTTRDPKVRDFAKMMVRDHAKSTAEVKAAAMKSRVRVMPARLTPAQTEMMAQLRADRGTARDQAYVTQQRTAHEQALSLHQTFATEGKAPALRAVAAKTAPVVQHHLEMLQAM